MPNIEGTTLNLGEKKFSPLGGELLAERAAAITLGGPAIARRSEVTAADPPPARRRWWAGVLCAVIMFVVSGSARLDSSTSGSLPYPKVRASVVAMVDNFTTDRSLNHSLWVDSGSAFDSVAATQSTLLLGGLGQYFALFIGAPKTTFLFSPSTGLDIGGTGEFGNIARIQSAAPYTPPFSMNTQVMVPGGRKTAFFLMLTDSSGRKGLMLIGGVDPSAHLNGVDVLQPGPKGKPVRQSLFRSWQSNAWYSFSISVGAKGNGLLQVRQPGMGTREVQARIGQGPLWLTFGQVTNPGSASVHWRWIKVFSSSPASGIPGASFPGGSVSVVESPFDTKTTARLEQSAKQVPQVEQQQLEQWMKKEAARGMSPALLAQIRAMEEHAIQQNAKFTTQAVPREFQSSMQLPPGGSLYLYGVVSDGRSDMVDFEAMPPGAWVRGPEGGPASGEIASSTSNNARAILSGLAGGYTIGGVSISGFGSWHASYGRSSGLGTGTTADEFVISHTSLVVVLGVAAGLQTVSLSGVSGLVPDASLPGMAIAHAYLRPGTYTVIEHSQPLAGGKSPSSTSHAVGVYIFDGAGR